MSGNTGGAVEIIELRSKAEFEQAFPVVRELHGELNERKYAELLAEMVPSGYRMFAVQDEGELAAVAGMQVITNLYYERHLYLYDLVATARARSKGHGAALVRHVEYFARREGCKYVALACGKEREGALRFYERFGFERPGYTMRKALH
jgi:GNAT superfamily N-acetyltransferase